MSLSIKSDEAEQLARRVAALTGESLTRAITVALRARLQQLEADDRDSALRRARRLSAIGADAAQRWVEPYASTTHGELLYDECGLPQ